MANIAIQLAIGVGGWLLQQLLAPKPEDQYGPRISDINIAAVNPGNQINRHWGTMKMPCQIMWHGGLIETKIEEEVGGKGLGSGPKSITYKYSVDCAFGVCVGEIHRIRKIRANQKLLWVHPDLAGELEQEFDEAYQSEASRLLELGVEPEEAHVSAFIFAFNYYSLDEYDLGTEEEAVAYVMAHPVNDSVLNQARVETLFAQMFDPLNEDAEYEKYKKRFDDIHIYTGSETQLPDAVIEAKEGVGNVPAHRGVCYFVLQNLQLEDFGNAVPTFSAEVEKTASEPLLTDILADICADSGMLPDEYSVYCNMPIVPINGFAVTQNTSGREIINELQKIFPFDGTETNFKLRFNWVEKRAQYILRREDMGSYMVGSERPDTEEVTLLHDYDFPKRLNFTYQEPERNYSTNTVFAKREQTESNMIEEVNVAISMKRQDAKTWIEKQLAHRFMGKRTYKAVLPSKYVICDPCDVFLIEDPLNPGKYQMYRMTEVNVGANCLVEVVYSDYYYYEGADALTEIVEAEDEELALASTTYAFMYDTPLLTDTEPDNIGFYAILGGARTQWGGGILVVDVASGGYVEVYGEQTPVGVTGSSWVRVAENTDSVLNGFAMTVPNTAANPYVRDWSTSIIVRLIDLQGVLNSADPVDLEVQPINLAFIGNELIQYQTVEELQNGMWRLSGLLRGLRGTDYYISRHTAGERFVKLRSTAVSRVEHSDQFIGQEGTFRAYGLYEKVEDVQSFTFTPEAKSKWPLAPGRRTEVQLDTGDWVFEWVPRRRQNGGLYNGDTIQLDQTFEKYSVDVIDEGGDVVRTTELTDLRSWTYTAAMQTTDFGGTQDEVRVNIYQIGQVGSVQRRGFPQEVRAAA